MPPTSARGRAPIIDQVVDRAVHCEVPDRRSPEIAVWLHDERSGAWNASVSPDGSANTAASVWAISVSLANAGRNTASRTPRRISHPGAVRECSSLQAQAGLAPPEGLDAVQNRSFTEPAGVGFGRHAIEGTAGAPF